MELAKLPRELLFDIVMHLPNGQSWKTFVSLSKEFYLIANNPLLQEHKDKHINHFLSILKLVPIDQWHIQQLSTNPNLTFEFLIHHLYVNPGTKAFIQWDWVGLSSNPGISFDEIMSHWDLPWDWIGISHRHDITIDIVQKYPHKSWFWYAISKNPNMTWDIVTKYFDTYPWNYRGLSLNPNITMNIVLSLPDEAWDFEALSHHPNITFQDMLDHDEFPWCAEMVVYNPNLTLDIILSHPDYFKDEHWCALTMQKCITMDYIFTSKVPMEYWNLGFILTGKATPDDVKKYPNIMGDFAILSRNPNFTYADLTYFDKTNFLGNPNLTFDLYKQLNFTGVCNEYLFTNKFRKHEKFALAQKKIMS